MRAKHNQTSCYLRPPFLGTPLVPSRSMIHPRVRGALSAAFSYLTRVPTRICHSRPFHPKYTCRAQNPDIPRAGRGGAAHGGVAGRGGARPACAPSQRDTGPRQGPRGRRAGQPRAALARYLLLALFSCALYILCLCALFLG